MLGILKDPTEIARHSQRYPFVSVPKSTYQDIKERHEEREVIYVVCESHEDGSYTYNEKYSKIAEDARMSGTADGAICEYMQNKTKKSFKKPDHSDGYIECKGEESLPLNNFLLYS